MPPFFNGIPFVGVGADGEITVPFATEIDFTGADVTRGAGELAQRASVSFPIGLQTVESVELTAPAASVLVPLPQSRLSEIVLTIVPVTPGAGLQGRIAIGSVVLPGLTDYLSAIRTIGASGAITTGQSGDLGAAFMVFVLNVGEQTDEGVSALIRVFDAANITRRVFMEMRGTQLRADNTVWDVRSFGSTRTNLSAASDLELSFSAGNIASMSADIYSYATP